MAAAFPAEAVPAAGAVPVVFPAEGVVDVPVVSAGGGPAAGLGLDQGPAAFGLASVASAQDPSSSTTRPAMAAAVRRTTAETAMAKGKEAVGRHL